METSHGLVMKAAPYGEHHRLVTVLTPKHGVLRAVAHGAQKQNSPLHACTVPCTEATFLLDVREQQLSAIRQGELLRGYETVKTDFLRSAYAQAISELVLQGARSEPFHRPSRVYSTVRACWTLLGESPSPRAVLVLAELHLFLEIGIDLRFDSCAICGDAIAASTGFSFADGGWVCERCQKAASVGVGIVALTAGTYDLMRRMRTADVSEVRRVHTAEPIARESARLLRTMLREWAGIHLQADAVIDQLDSSSLS